jgi:hypothetical protein
MNTLDFLRWVLPTSGNVVLGLPKTASHGGTWWDHKYFDGIEAAAETAEKLDAAGTTVYFAVHRFGPEYQELDSEGNGKLDKKGNPKMVMRKQGNVVAARAIYDDYDVKPGKDRHYQSKKEALDDIVKLSRALKLTPTVVDSGGGYHAYYHFDEDIDEGTWDELAAMKRDVTTHLAMMVDSMVNCDSARVLRPVGLHNRKYDTPLKVKLIKQGKQYSVDKVRSVLQTYIQENNVTPAPTRNKGAAMANPFAAAGEYPPSDADKVAENCAAVREFRDTMGNVDEPHWHRAIGILKFCEDGESKIHKWSEGYDGYSHQETQEKIDMWEVGPTSCIEMDKHIGCMKDCPMAGKCKFPIQLGFSEDAPSVEEETAPVSNTKPTTAQQPQTMVEGQNIPYWPTSGWRWNGASLSRSYTDADGVTTWKPFCRSFIYPLNRIKDGEGTWVIHWRTKEKNGDWREFFMPTSELASTDLMAKTFASYEVFLTRTRNARNDMAEFAETLIETLQAWKMETKTYSQFGWLEDRSGFVMGTKMITKDDTLEVLCAKTVPPDVAVDFGRSGTLEEWIANIETLYNRKGAEPYQFALCHSMGSALVELMGSSNWHGLPLAFTGHGGTGKTTACRIACGFFGNHKHMERQASEQGTTLNATIRRVAIMGSVPMLLDELSGRTPDELTRTGYALAHGRDKERLKTNGEYATVGGEWFKNSFITSNDSILETISKLPAGHKVEATQLRFFEVPLPQGFITKTFSDVPQGLVEHHMDYVYGEACLPFLRFIIKNQDWVRRQMVAARSKFNPQSDDDNKERFYRDTIVTALVAGKIATKLGLISFDVNEMKKWALSAVKSLRESRKEINTDISEHLAAYIATLQGRLIVTKRLGNANAKKEDSAFMLRAPAVGRICTDDQKAFITIKSVSEWCKEFGVAPSAMREELDRAGYLIYQADGTFNPRMYIGQGSTVPSGMSRCYELNFNKLYYGKALALVPNDKPAEAAN